MRVRIESGRGARGAGQGSAELTAYFAEWLAEDRSVSRFAEIRPVRAGAADGAMSGELLEWIGLVVSSGFSTVSLVYAHRSFRASLPPRSRGSVRMVIESGDVRVTVESGTGEDVARVAAALGATGEGAPSGGGTERAEPVPDENADENQSADENEEAGEDAGAGEGGAA